MAKFPCQDGEPCNRCGGCCNIRENFRMALADEALIKQQVYKRVCVIYLYPLNKYTISLTYDEARRLDRIAKKKGINISILPKKVIYDAKNDNAVVWDWFVDHEICPFLLGKNECSIYSNRPEICRMFPEIKNEQLFDIKKSSANIMPADEPYDLLVEKAKNSLKHQNIKC